MTVRVCHLAKYYSPFRGGIETHVQALATAQQASGLEVTVACINHRNRAGENVWSRRLARTARESSIIDGVVLERFGKFATLARFDFCLGLNRFIGAANSRFDLLHLHVPNPTFAIAVASVSRNIPLVVTYHSDIVKQKIIRQPFRLIESIVFGCTDRFIASTAAYAQSSEILKRYQAQTEIIPFGIDVTPYVQPSQTALQFRDRLLELAAGMPLWLSVGRLVYYKGLEYAIRALPACRGQLVIVGSGELKPSLQALAVTLNVADRIHWMDNLTPDELIGAYHAASAFWFPSVARSEAFGLVQIEAMASGCPVINTSIPGSGVPSVSLNEVSGLTVPPKDPIAFATAANRIDHEPSLRQRLSNGARQRAVEQFSLQRMVEQTSVVYRSVLASPAPKIAACPPAHSPLGRVGLSGPERVE